MKKLLTLLLSLFMILSLVGCNSNKDEEEKITHIHTYEVDEDGVWICKDDNDILSNTDKPYVAVLENNKPQDIIPLDSITSKKTNLGNGVIYKQDNTIFYNGNNAQTIIIKTEKDNKNNEDKVVINAPNDTVYHYGSSSVISLDAVATNSFHEYGKVDLITLTVARIVLETLSNVKEIYLDINNPNYNYESAIIAVKEKVEIPNLSRDTVDLQEGEVKTLAVIQQLKDEIKQDNTIETKTKEESFVKIENVAKSDKDLIVQAFLSPNADTKDNTELETKQTSTVTLEEAKEGSSHPASKNTFVSKDEKVIEVVKPQETSKKDETKQETKPVVTPSVAQKQEETKKDDPTPTPTPAETKYTVTFDMQGHGTQVPSQSIEKNKKVVKPTDPIVDDYLFGGWYKENTYTNPWNFDVDTVTSNTTLYAKWTQFIFIEKTTAVSNLIYNGNEQTGVVEGVGYTVENGKKTNAGNYQAIVKLLTGYKWSDGTKSDLIIDWSIAKATFDMSGVTFVDKAVTYNGQEQKIEISGTLPEGVMVSYTDNKGTNVGTYEAIASFTGDSENYEAINNKNATLTINKAPLTATADNKTVIVGDEAPEYTVRYTGWVEGESIETVKPTVAAVLACSCTEISAVGEYDITFTTEPEFTNYSVTTVGGKLTVSPVPTYTVTFNLNGITSTAPETQTVVTGEKVTKPADPSATGYTFGGWYKEDTCTNAWNFNTDTVTSNTTLYAHWVKATPDDVAYYTLKEKATWFSAFSGTTTDKTKITNIIFCKELPKGVSAGNPVNLTDNNENGKVNGYIIANEGNYKIYIVGDYIFGNTDCTQMFSGFNNLKTLDLSNFDTSNVTNMIGMFFNCKVLSSLDLSKFDTSNVTDMQSMFNGCNELSELDLSNSFDTSKVTNMQSMFLSCKNLTQLDISSFNTSKVENMNSMFENCSALETMTFGNSFDTSNVTDMGDIFLDCTKLQSLGLSGFNTSKVTIMTNMFKNCETLTTLDLNSFDTSEVTNMNSMFVGCSKLTSVKINNENEKIAEQLGKDWEYNGNNKAYEKAKQ